MIRLYDASHIKPVGTHRARLQNTLTGQEYLVEFLVLQPGHTPLLGAKASQEMNLISVQCKNILSIEQTASLKRIRNTFSSKEEVLSQFKDVFDGALGKLPHTVRLEIDEMVTPVQLPPRKVPLMVKNELKQELERLTDLGVMKEETEPTKWVSSLVIAKKSNGKMRLCIDPQPLNKALKRSHYPLHVLDDILPNLSNAKVFSVCDVQNGFWHLQLDEDSSRLTTFNTPFGRYRWTRLPFGVAPAPELFQRHLDQALEGLGGVHTIADDILVCGYGQSQEEADNDHDENLARLLQRCREKGIKLNAPKFRFKESSVPYCGHSITSHGLRSDPKKTAAITSMPAPSDIAGLRRFLGMTNYLTRFLPSLADLCQPLRELLTKDVAWQWMPKHQDAMDRVCEAVTKAPVLQYFDKSKTTTIQCDASGTGLGAVLLQEGKPVEFASRALSSAERNYAQIEKELLAVLFGLEHFDQYVYGRHVDIESDHRPLQIIAKKPMANMPKRLQRIFLKMMRYCYTLAYKPGKELVLADTLSRAYLELSPETNEFEEVARLDTVHWLGEVNAILDAQLTESFSDQLRAATLTDPQMIALAETIVNGWPDQKGEVQQDLKSYFDFRDELTTENGLIMKGQRCVVPQSVRPEALSRIHRSHIGQDGCVRFAREHVFWPGMTSQIKDFVSRCETCQTFSRKQQRETLHQELPPDRPWQEVACDLFELEGKHYLVTVDCHSNFAETDQLSSTTAFAVIGKLKQHFARYGVPERVRTDNGPQFSSEEFHGFSQEWQFKHMTSSPGHPQSNGKAENAVGTVKQLFRKAMHSGRDVWQSLLDFRNTPTQGMTVSPAQRFLGRRTRTAFPIHSTKLEPDFPVYGKQLQEQRQRQAAYHNKHARELKPLNIGDRVRVQSFSRRKFWWPATVVKRVGKHSYIVRSEEGRTYRRNRRFLRSSPREKKGAEMPQEEHASMDHEHETEELEPEDDYEVVEQEDQEPAGEEKDQNREQTGCARRDLETPGDSYTTRQGRNVRRPKYLNDYYCD